MEESESIATSTWEEFQENKFLCRGDKEPSIEIRSQLKCRYVHQNNPYLFIGPLKEEEVYLSPRILLYRELMYDAEIKVIQEMATPKVNIFLVKFKVVRYEVI